MPYTPQRRHVVGIISNTTQALNLVEHLYQPNLLILFSRMLVQMQIAAAGLVHPNRSLLSLCLMLTLMSATAVLLHFLDHLAGPGKGVMLDFVGQARTASLTRILLLDLLIYALQIHCLTISYLNNKTSATLSPVPLLPYADMLLPTADVAEEVTPEDFDIESGLRRRKGKGRATEDLEEEDEAFWLDDPDEGDTDVRPSERDRLLSQSSPTPRRAREPPRVLSLTLSHLIRVITHLPAPDPTPRLFAGATPSGSPRAAPTSLPDTASTDVRETLFSGLNEEEEEYDQSEEVSSRSILRDLETSRRDGGDSSEDGASAERMPGDYRVRGRGNGG